MDVVVERCAGLDVHKDFVVACVRYPGAEGERKTETASFLGLHRRSSRPARLALDLRGDPGGDGSHRRLQSLSSTSLKTPWSAGC